MITLRPTLKLARRLGIELNRAAVPISEPYADWCVHAFNVGRYRHLIAANTRSMLSVVFHARGIVDEATLLDRVLSAIGEQLRADGRGFFHERFIVPATAEARFAPIGDRAILGSINELVFQARVLLEAGDLAPADLSVHLAEVPMSVLQWKAPVEVFPTMAAPDAFASG